MKLVEEKLMSPVNQNKILSNNELDFNIELKSKIYFYFSYFNIEIQTDIKEEDNDINNFECPGIINFDSELNKNIFKYNSKNLKYKNNNPLISPCKKKNTFDLQININNNNENEKSEKIASIIPIILPQINSPTLKGNFNTKKNNIFEEANNLNANNINKDFTTKNIHRKSLKVYK